MSNTNKAKSAQLGMPHGTAANRLRKQLLFKYVQKAGDDICHVCDNKIEAIEDFSIEHIKPWFNRDPELFWDLDNIAFSHMSCNRPHTIGQYKLIKQGAEGTAWCSDCQKHLPVVNFHKKNSRLNGLQKQCKDCKSERNAKRYDRGLEPRRGS